MKIDNIWYIYIPGTGDWRIPYAGDSKKMARKVYLKHVSCKRLPAHSYIWRR